MWSSLIRITCRSVSDPRSLTSPAFDAATRFFGAEGSSEAHYDYRVSIAGAEPWDAGLGPAQGQRPVLGCGNVQRLAGPGRGGKTKVVCGEHHQRRIPQPGSQGAESALSAMLGRTAAYTGKLVTWDELMKSKEVFDPKIDISKFA